MRKLLNGLLLLSVYGLLLQAGTYDDPYTPLADLKTKKEKKDLFMYGDFQRIVRYDMLSYQDGKLEQKDKSYLHEIIKDINETIKGGDKVLVKIIGHTNEATDDYNEKAVDSKSYANKIQNLFRYSLDSNKSKEISKNYAMNVQKILCDGGIDKNITYVEYRGGLDMGFSDGTVQGRDLSNRVMVTMYILIPKDKDSDGDGVIDSMDKCPNTPKGVKVTKNGCPLDSDQDGVADSLDKCPNTPRGVSVDLKGCPLDSDKDGVWDYKDDCPKTPLGLKVDVKGCPIEKHLALNFKSASDKILQDSYPRVVEFAEFLKLYPMYNAEIIGHTDSQGKAAANMKLSQARALTVKNALISEGIDASRLKATGRGEFDPIATNRTKKGRRANRRIEVKLSYGNN